MINNWSDGKNLIFKAGTNSEEARKFKQTKQGRWISELPAFSSFSHSDSNDNLSKTVLK